MSTSDFDYVVIGGGTSGLVVATRLVEDPAIRVCVLEAGEDVTTKPDNMVPGWRLWATSFTSGSH
jgi:choline dehydrogenase-like flavoprotein